MKWMRGRFSHYVLKRKVFFLSFWNTLISSSLILFHWHFSDMSDLPGIKRRRWWQKNLCIWSLINDQQQTLLKPGCFLDKKSLFASFTSQRTFQLFLLVFTSQRTFQFFLLVFTSQRNFQHFLLVFTSQRTFQHFLLVFTSQRTFQRMLLLADWYEQDWNFLLIWRREKTWCIYVSQRLESKCNFQDLPNPLSLPQS